MRRDTEASRGWSSGGSASGVQTRAGKPRSLRGKSEGRFMGLRGAMDGPRVIVKRSSTAMNCVDELGAWWMEPYHGGLARPNGRQPPRCQCVTVD